MFDVSGDGFDTVQLRHATRVASPLLRAATINDVADLAGVSKKTVSRVINDSPLVNRSTREGIKAVIDGINYQPDPQARGLAFRSSYLVGLIYDNPNPQYVVNIQLGILDGGFLVSGSDF